jgi:tetratricopeptide (TPR) repeat protein
LAIAEERGDPLRRADALKFLGMIQRAQGHLSLADESLSSANRLAEESEDVLLAAEVARELGETRSEMGQPADARKFFQRAVDLFREMNASLDATKAQERLDRIHVDSE